MRSIKQKILRNKKLAWCGGLLVMAILACTASFFLKNNAKKLILGAVTSCDTEWNKQGLCYKPFNPKLPKAGELFTDPVFKTKIIRLTDQTNSPFGSRLNTESSLSVFNSDGSLFFLQEKNGPTELYFVDPARQQAQLVGTLSASFGFDGAAWDKKDPLTLYVISPDSGDEVNGSPSLSQITITAQKPLTTKIKFLTDFSLLVPNSTTFDSQINISQDGNQLLLLATTPVNQSTADNAPTYFDTVLIWNKQTGKAMSLDASSRLQALVESCALDASGKYALIKTVRDLGGKQSPPWYIWNIGQNTVTAVSDDNTISDLRTLGSNSLYEFSDGQLTERILSNPKEQKLLAELPKKDGKIDPYEKSNTTMLAGSPPSFFSGLYVSEDLGIPLSQSVKSGGAVYEFRKYSDLADNNSAPPEFLRFNGQEYQNTNGTPKAAGQWSYDPSTDLLKIWSANNLSSQNSSNLAVFDWRPFMDEIVQFSQMNGIWTWRRLAHHRMLNDGTEDMTPKINANQQGTMVLFQSNWDGQLKNSDGSLRTDTFLLFVPPFLANLAVHNITETSADISWTTSTPSDATIEYGTDAGYGNIVADHRFLSGDHLLTLSHLLPKTTYHVKISSKDTVGSVGTIPDFILTTN